MIGPIILTVCILKDSYIWFETIYYLKLVHCTYLGVSSYSLKKIFCLKTFFSLTNNVDPDEISHYTAFYLGLHCLQKYSLGGSVNKWLFHFLLRSHSTVYLELLGENGTFFSTHHRQS